jgi:hypothetical protein
VYPWAAARFTRSVTAVPESQFGVSFFDVGIFAKWAVQIACRENVALAFACRSDRFFPAGFARRG